MELLWQMNDLLSCVIRSWDPLIEVHQAETTGCPTNVPLQAIPSLEQKPDNYSIICSCDGLGFGFWMTTISWLLRATKIQTLSKLYIPSLGLLGSTTTMIFLTNYIGTANFYKKPLLLCNLWHGTSLVTIAFIAQTSLEQSLWALNVFCKSHVSGWDSLETADHETNQSGHI